MSPRTSDLLGAYALGAVDASERRAVEAAAALDPAVRAEVDDLLMTVERLDSLAADGTTAPGAALWRRIEEEIAAEDALATADRVVRLAPRQRRRRVQVRRFAAVAAVLVISGLTVRVAQLTADNRSLEQALANPVQSAADRASQQPGAVTIDLAGPDGRVVAVPAVIQDDGVGYVVAHSLPALASDRTYQLWAIVDGVVLSAGVMGPDPGVVPFQVAGGVDGLAITDEVAGGVVSSSNDPVAVWVVDA